MKKVNDKVVGAKADKAQKTQDSYKVRDNVIDAVGDFLANANGVDVVFAEPLTTKGEPSGKKHLFVTIDGVQVQLSIIAKNEITVFTADQVTATFKADK